MPTGPSTLADLRKAGVVSSQEIVGAIDAYMRDPGVAPYHFRSGHSLDLAVIVDATPALDRVERAGPQEKTFRNALAIAIMAARPTTP
ncbi:hypothetical protein [Methylobacterium radiotolerans]|uniref:Uncharacterized protein n=1 Tax=Methylobacterium radiotolerans (strain ATCC 27329 / DSM 1819 / JCM 2831 / NBRC 15690 / NCIMB 10815 / 0-1) TaxID=426355 RepID=B1MA97_METRJ|nr:hypothetical protein [Methylobacterium radiotolerans]ACB28422.1 hypothetical protein Mrad2831_6510 [Methylobacterium radiotolerans JCM 2831]GEN01514.1 hypothetical protein MRA01_60530 [Methylobacterium radiotolerans]